MKAPSDARHKRTDLSKEAEAINLRKYYILFYHSIIKNESMQNAIIT